MKKSFARSIAKSINNRMNIHFILISAVSCLVGIKSDARAISNNNYVISASDQGQQIITCPNQVLSELPDEGKVIFSAYEKSWELLKKETAKKLKDLQDKYTKAGKLDEALALRAKVWQLSGVITCWQQPTEVDIGKKFLFEVVGVGTGALWGSGPYTNDANPNLAAVHSGLVKIGEKKLLEFEIVPGINEYIGSLKNGITSQKYGPWPVAYVIRIPSSLP